MMGPYLAGLSYSSNKGTANSLRFFGTAKMPTNVIFECDIVVHFSGRGTM
jgi:hypothetical protein